MRFLSRAFLGLFIASLTIAFLAIAVNTLRVAVQDRLGQDPRDRPRREQALVVNLVEVLPQDITPLVTTFGSIQSGRTLELRINRGGPITEVAPEFVEGGQVTAGQLLIQTDDTDEKTTLDRAQLELEVVRAELNDATTSVSFAQRDLEVAQQQVILRRQALNRQQDLLARNVGTGAAIENAEIALATANQAVLSRERAVAQSIFAQTLAQNRLQLAQLVFEEAERALVETRLLAEFSGVLTEVNAVSGGLVNANEQVGKLIDPKRLEVDFFVSNIQYSRLLGQRASLTGTDITVVMSLQDFSIEATGTISREAAFVEAGQTGRRLFASLAPQDATQFRSGDFVTVSAYEPELQNVVRLPASSIDTSGTVLVLGPENRLDLAEVEILRRQGNDVIVRADELHTRQVVAQRTPLLGAGILVQPATPNDETPAQQEPEEIALTDERRARLVAAVEGNNRMPPEAKARVLDLLAKPTVPAATVERIESRMRRGGENG